MASYYEEPFKLRWNPRVQRFGLGTLLKKVNHVAIIVKDVERSLEFYVNVLGLQRIRRPNLDGRGAWLTMGNADLHLIQGTPVVPPRDSGDSIIVPHISVESDDIDAALAKLDEMKIPYIKNVAQPNDTGAKSIVQCFLRDPDGYYIELCNCNILTNFCLGKDDRFECY